ncbi:MAG: 30S ribosomal protein S18 [Caldilineaceae bacterium]
MSEQENPKAEEAETVAAEAVTEAPASEPVESPKEPAAKASVPAAAAPSRPASSKPAPSKPAPSRAPAPVIEEDDDVYEDDDDDDYHIPSEYTPSGSGRPRRIGSDVKVADIDYKKVAVLSRFLDSRGRILSRRKTRVSAKVQRRIVTAIKRARHLALIPYTADQTRIVRKRR